ncbi:hypothetical protein B4U79_10355 [Dinothrombium tinctorium]|uniref:Uncharacterized protein n=1 Tax=Dinothrombium tinctorium TaxID=1965070 RepID=A0A3S3SBX9_9ACAR|nr:hypothetical protein B4U79_10355 [Dinothrombium tinctorium]
MVICRTWVTEITSQHPNNQFRKRTYVPPCTELEMNMVECIEAYGIPASHHMCQAYINDFGECVHHEMAMRRSQIMQRERVKQILKGKRKPSEVFGPKPDPNAYLPGPFNP